MNLYFVTNDIIRYKEFSSLIPYEIQLILYKKKYNKFYKNIDMLLLDHKLKDKKEVYFILDELRYEIYCLNNFPGTKFDEIFNIGVETLRSICKLRNNRMNQTTIFELYDHEFNLVETFKSEIQGTLAMEGEVKTIDDLFLPNLFDVVYSKIKLDERARIGSLTMATKAFIDWKERFKN